MRRKKFVYRHPRPMVTVDAVLFSVAGAKLRLLLVERGKPPFQGRWAFPGGFVEMDEDLPDAASRELEEETGLSGVALDFFGTYGTPGRDPRGRTISSVFFGIVPYDRTDVTAGDDADKALWHPAGKPPPLAFDHDLILKDVKDHLKRQVLAGDGAFRFLPPRFQPEELRGVFEAVLRKRISPAKFSAEMKRTGLIKDAPGGTKRLCKKTFNRLRKELAIFRF